MDITPQKLDQEIEKAIKLVVDCASEKCTNPKPIILHGIRVGLGLLELNQPRHVILAGFIHDLIEDTNCTIEQIKDLFGEDVSELVNIVSQDHIEDYQERWKALMDGIEKYGEQAMILKLVDLKDNAHYIPFIKQGKYAEGIVWRHDYGMSRLEPYLKDTKLYQETVEAYKKAFEKLGI